MILCPLRSQKLKPSFIHSKRKKGNLRGISPKFFEITDIGPDLKGLSVETFMRITGINDKELAEKYHRTAWKALKYLVDNYKDEVFVGVGIPYNRDLISMEEIAKIGEEICKIDPDVQVCALDYRPEFRNLQISRPTLEEMVMVWKTLKSTGLRTVICQTVYGYIGPHKPSFSHR